MGASLKNTSDDFQLKEVLPVVQRRYDELVKQRNALVEKVNQLREAIGFAPYMAEVSVQLQFFYSNTHESFAFWAVWCVEKAVWSASKQSRAVFV